MSDDDKPEFEIKIEKPQLTDPPPDFWVGLELHTLAHDLATVLADIKRALTAAGFPVDDGDVLNAVRVALNNNAALAHQLKEAQSTIAAWRENTEAARAEWIAAADARDAAHRELAELRQQVVARHPADPAAELAALRKELAEVPDPDIHPDDCRCALCAEHARLLEANP